MLIKDFRRLDTFLRNPEFSYDNLCAYLVRIEENFIYDQNKQLSQGNWRTSVTYKWNSDSSLVFIYANKSFPVGFSREKIIHSGDSVLLVYRFSTEPLGSRTRDDYTFLESVYYLRHAGTIKHLDRIAHWKSQLKDTIAFRKKPFTDFTANALHNYSFELKHCEEILRLN